jgi:hypothetical protein
LRPQWKSYTHINQGWISQGKFNQRRINQGLVKEGLIEDKEPLWYSVLQNSSTTKKEKTNGLQAWLV